METLVVVRFDEPVDDVPAHAAADGMDLVLVRGVSADNPAVHARRRLSSTRPP